MLEQVSLPFDGPDAGEEVCIFLFVDGPHEVRVHTTAQEVLHINLKGLREITAE